jgi:hypothetical protein
LAVLGLTILSIEQSEAALFDMRITGNGGYYAQGQFAYTEATAPALIVYGNGSLTSSSGFDSFALSLWR